MEKITVVLVLVAIFSAACGGGGGGGGGRRSITTDLDIVSPSALTNSQLAAIRDLGLYDTDEAFASDPTDPVTYLSTKIATITGGIAAKAMGSSPKGLKETYTESDTETISGLNGTGSMVIDYTLTMEDNGSSGSIKMDYTVTADNFHMYGACLQITRFSGIMRCSTAMNIASSGDYTAEGACYTDGPLTYFGSDEVQHDVGFDYAATMNGYIYSGGVVIEDYSMSGFVTIGGVAIKIEELGEPLACSNPSILSVDPEDGEADVVVDASVSVSFNNEMDKSSAEAAFTLSDCSDDVVLGTFGWDGNTMSFTPAEPLEYQSTYCVAINEVANDADGYPVWEGFSSLFTTGDYPITVNDPIPLDDMDDTVSGLAWDGSYLWVIEKTSYGNCSLQKIDAASGAGVGAPVEVDLTDSSYCYSNYLEWDGAAFWTFIDDSSDNIVRFTTGGVEGDFAASFSYGISRLTIKDGDIYIYESGTYLDSDNGSSDLTHYNTTGGIVSQDTILTPAYYYADAITWCAGEFWVFEAGNLYAIDLDAKEARLRTSTGLSEYSTAIDMTCGAENNSIWIMISEIAYGGTIELIRIDLP